jgi:uncharacterized protein (TIGR03382 family)
VGAWGDFDAGTAAGGFVAQLNAAGSELLFATPFYFYKVRAVAENERGDLFLVGPGAPASMITVDPFEATSPSSSGGPALAKISIVAPPPTLTSIDPTFGPIGGDTSITVTGAQFAVGTTLALGGSAATGVQINSPTELVAITAAHAPGIVDVTVTNSDGQMATLTKAFTYGASLEDGGDAGDAGPDAGDAGPPDAGDAGDAGIGSAKVDAGMDGGLTENSSSGCSSGHAPGPQEMGLFLVLVGLILRRRRGSSSNL